MVRTLLHLTTKLIPRRLTPGVDQTGIRSLIGVGTTVVARAHSVLYLPPAIPEAAPKGISGRTSYLRVRLAFHPYPQFIQVVFNRH